MLLFCLRRAKGLFLTYLQGPRLIEPNFVCTMLKILPWKGQIAFINVIEDIFGILLFLHMWCLNKQSRKYEDLPNQIFWLQGKVGLLFGYIKMLFSNIYRIIKILIPSTICVKDIMKCSWEVESNYYLLIGTMKIQILYGTTRYSLTGCQLERLFRGPHLGYSQKNGIL